MKETKTSDHTSNFNPFAGPEVEKVIYTTQSQSEIWVACKLGDQDASRAYNESISLILRGDLNKSALQTALQNLVKRHEAIRAVFSTDGRFMTIFKQLNINLEDHDIVNFTPSQKDKFLKDYLSKDANYIFDLLKGPLLKVGLIKLSEVEHHLILTGHHIVCDGWSFGIMIQELGSLYSSIVNKTSHNLPNPESFAAYAIEQQAYLESESHAVSETFWLNQFKDDIPKLTLTTDYQRPQYRTFKCERLDLPLESDLVDAFKKIGLKQGSSFVTTLLSAFEIFLYTQTGQETIVLGLPSADQAASGKTQMIGHCVNLLPLRSEIDANISFKDHLEIRKTQLFDAYDHQKFSFGELLQKLSIARDPSRIPLVPVVFNVDIGMDDGVSFSGLNHELKSNPRAYETFEIFLNASGSDQELMLEWSYNSNLFKADTIREMMDTFVDIITKIVENPDIKIGDIRRINTSEYSKLNDTSRSYPQFPLHELIAKRAQINPSKEAIKFGNTEIAYGDLVKQTHQVAHYLKAHGIEKGDIIAVSLPRSIELVITLIAIMECGAAYLPLDPSYPSKRLEFMLEDSETKLLITSNTFLTALQSDAKQLIIEDIFSDLSKQPHTPFDEIIEINAIAYLLYTSGSTGKPKGVPITHKNLVNLLFSVLEKPGIKETDTLISITTISFDIAMVELFAPLLVGAKLVMTNEETAKDTRLLLDLMKNESITIMQATPATWQMLIYSGWEDSLPIRAISTGEALPLVLAKSILDRVTELWNMYGPTETTIWSAMKKVSKTEDFITIGCPMANTQLYIVDEHNRLVSPGNTGELCIAGDGVANGYWNRDDLTYEKFIHNPFQPEFGPILYRTGDLAKLISSRDVQCLGRIDQQVKIRGQRIELGEIEQALDSLKGINSSVVILNEDVLMAYIITSEESETDIKQVNIWKEILKDFLPSHMIPHQFYVVKEFPTTLSGKIDRKALQQQLPIKSKKPNFSEPSTPSEKIIATIWQDCLGIERIDVFSDFFELGGHSVVGVQVMARLEKETKNRLPLVALLKHPTVKQLAEYMDSKHITWDSLVPLKPEGTKPALYVVHGANHNVLMFNALAHALDKDQPVYGLQSRGLNGVTEPHDSIDQMAADYISEIVASNPEGPYALGGFSYGGIVAYEMARQLLAMGKQVTILAQFDTYVYPSYYYTHPLIKKLVMNLFQIGKVVFLSFNMFASKKLFLRRIALLKIQISGLFLRLRVGKEKQYEMQFNIPYKMEHNHSVATAAYNITPQDIVIDLFRAQEEINFVHDHDLLGWKKMGKKGIRKHMVPGNHVDMFDEPNVESLARSLQNVLDNKSIHRV